MQTKPEDNKKGPKTIYDGTDEQFDARLLRKLQYKRCWFIVFVTGIAAALTMVASLVYAIGQGSKYGVYGLIAGGVILLVHLFYTRELRKLKG